MNERRIPSPEDDNPDIADAEALFRDGVAPAPAPKRPPPPVVDAGDDYAIEDFPDDPPPRPVAAPVEVPRVVRKPKAEAVEQPEPVRPVPTATVEEVWSRGAEWGGTLALLAVSCLLILGVLYFLLTHEMFGPAFLVMLASAPALVVVGYPILITLERPVRITPEQAVNDFYSSLSHHAPHFRRMWLLLSDAGRVSGSYASFDGFRAYWKRRSAELHAGKAPNFTPLKFQVEDFRSPKSAGLTTIDVSYTVNVFIRGKQGDGPVGSVKVNASLVKGPDRMWYLNKGTLP